MGLGPNTEPGEGFGGASREVAHLERYVNVDRAHRSRAGCGSVSVFERMRARWGVGFWGMIAVLTAFSLAGLTTLRLKEFVIGYILPATAPGWVQWTVYLIVMLPIYQVLLLGYGTLLGQFDFFWSKMKALGRLIAGRPVGASGQESAP